MGREPEGFVNAEIRPKVEGYLESSHILTVYIFVKEMMFEIDRFGSSRPLSIRRGDQGAWKQLAKTRKDVERFTPLVAQKAISQQELITLFCGKRVCSRTGFR
jgi:hypothetical protein